MVAAPGNTAAPPPGTDDLPRTVKTPPARIKLSLVTKPTKRSQSNGWPDEGDGGEVCIRDMCRDETGEWWAVFPSCRYGSNSDAWLAHARDKTTWRDFIFTGDALRRGRRGDVWELIRGFKVHDGAVTIGWAAWNTPGALASLGDTGGKPAGRVTARLADLRRDSDHDGVTDLLEKRLLTDLDNPDTDGDGLSDSEDGNPLVAPNPHPTDEEQVVQAVFAEYQRQEHSQQVQVVLLGGPKQELYGCAGPVLCLTDAEYDRLRREGGGIGPLDFTTRARSPVDEPKGPPTLSVQFSEGGTRAEVYARCIRGRLFASGYHGILRKTGDRWVVTSWGRVWIS